MLQNFDILKILYRSQINIYVMLVRIRLLRYDQVFLTLMSKGEIVNLILVLTSECQHP